MYSLNAKDLIGSWFKADRLAILVTWLNDRDQFTKPITKADHTTHSPLDDFTLLASDGRTEEEKAEYLYQYDANFIGNCIVFSLFEKTKQIGLTKVERDMTIYNLLN